jgi:hypothetical protein
MPCGPTFGLPRVSKRHTVQLIFMRVVTLTFIIGLVVLCRCLAQVPGDQLFSNSKIHEIRITGLFESLPDTLTNNYVLSFGFGQRQIRKIPYSPALIEIDGTALDTIGIRHKGFNSWWNSVKKPIKIDLNKYKDLQYDGLRKFNLHNGSGDPSFIRESISYSILRSLGIPAPRTSYAKVFIDNNYVGLYHIVEQIDNTFLDSNVGNHDGNLYVQQSNGSGGFGLDWISANQEDYYTSIALENHQKVNDWSSFIHFLDVLNHATDNSFRHDIQQVFDVDDYMQVLAFDVAINNLDWYGNSGRNYYLADVNGKFRWLPWDYNLSWRENAPSLDISGDEFPVLTRRILKDPLFHETFIRKYCSLLPYFERSFFDALVDDEVSRITLLMESDPLLDYPHEAFLTNNATTWDGIPGLKEFAAQRYTEITSTLQSLDVDCSVVTGIPNEEKNEFQMYPNPAKGPVYLAATGGNINDIVIINSVGQLVKRLSIDENGFIDVSDLTPGFYFVKVNDGKVTRTKLLCVAH